MEKTLDAKSIKKIGKEAGADIVGICDVEKLREADPAMDAERFLCGARSIVIAVVADPPYITHVKDPFVYARIAFPGYMKADGASAAMRAALEENGFFTARVERESTHTLDRTRKVAKVLSIKKAAEAAGLGVIGANQLLITPKFGPRVRMSAFITDAQLEAGKPLSESLCDDCGACYKNCPGGAFDSEGAYDMAACASYLFSGLKLSGLRENFISAPFETIKENFGRIGDTAAGWLTSFSEGRRLYYNCGECVRLCNGHLRARK
ncbi:MAG: 4Fe-4S binding protein [bacterium]